MNIPNGILDNWQNIQRFNSASCYLPVVGTRNAVPSPLRTPLQHKIYFSASEKTFFDCLVSPLMLKAVCMGL